jgi:hypothetical protein
MTKAEDFDIRRKHINEVCDQALGLVDRLGGELPAQWIEDMRYGIKVERYVALSTTDKMEFMFLQQNMSSGDNMEAALSDLKSSMEARAREWKTWDSDSYDSMNGDEAYRKSLLFGAGYFFEKAGECYLEQQSSEYSRASGSFRNAKVEYGKEGKYEDAGRTYVREKESTRLALKSEKRKPSKACLALDMEIHQQLRRIPLALHRVRGGYCPCLCPNLYAYYFHLVQLVAVHNVQGVSLSSMERRHYERICIQHRDCLIL